MCSSLRVKGFSRHCHLKALVLANELHIALDGLVAQPSGGVLVEDDEEIVNLGFWQALQPALDVDAWRVVATRT